MDPQTYDHGHSYIVWSDSDWLKTRHVTSQIIPPTNPGAYNGATHLLLEIHRMLQLAQKRFMHDLKTTVSWNCKMIMEILSDTLQLSYLVIKWTNMSNQKMWQHKIPEQEYDPNDKIQVYYKTVQDARNTLEPLNGE